MFLCENWTFFENLLNKMTFLVKCHILVPFLYSFLLELAEPCIIFFLNLGRSSQMTLDRPIPV
jgi:hypothetical protein